MSKLIMGFSPTQSDVHIFFPHQDETRSNPHLQRLARLEFEKLQRQVQAEDRKLKESEKEELETRIRQKKEQLGKLKPQLQNILAVSYLTFALKMEIDYKNWKCNTLSQKIGKHHVC